MKKRVVLESSILLAFSAFLAACGNMDTVIAKNASYSMDAFVGTRNLDDGAAISYTDSIRPSFSSEVEDDPDVTGLRISLETVGGIAAASDVVYRLSAEGSAREVDEEPILVPRFSGDLPAFDLPPDLAVGRYVLVMRVLGEDGVLFEERKSIYYLADAAFGLIKIVSYPPGTGTSSTAPLFPPKIKLLLRAEVDVDSRLDPYVAWYFGTKIIGMGRLADGANQILWETPSREGFHTVRVEVYPEPPSNPKAPDLIGASAEVTFATAGTAAAPGLEGESADYVRLYRFLGSLVDSADSQDGGRAFVRTNGVSPAWVPIFDSYGLSIGPNEQYRLDMPLVPPRSGVIETTLISTRVALSATGRIWTASFTASSGLEGLLVGLSSVSGGLQLTLAGNQKEAVAFVPAPVEIATDEAMLIEITLSVTPSEATALISVDKAAASDVAIPLISPLAGTGYVLLGGSQNSTATVPGAVDDTSSALRTAILDEFAVSVGE